MWGVGSRQDGQAQKLLLLHEAGHIQKDGTKSASHHHHGDKETGQSNQQQDPVIQAPPSPTTYMR